jgi:hypothetical protein
VVLFSQEKTYLKSLIDLRQDTFKIERLLKFEFAKKLASSQIQ